MADFNFPEQIEFDGAAYNLVFDPGNRHRPQVMPNYSAMYVQGTSSCEALDLGQAGVQYMTIVDAVLPALTAQQTGGFPQPERRYLCLKVDGVKTNPLAVQPGELVIYERRQEGTQAGTRGQRLFNAIIMATRERTAPAQPDTSWTQSMGTLRDAWLGESTAPAQDSAQAVTEADHAQ